MPLRSSITLSALLTLSAIAPGCMAGGADVPEGSPLYGDRSTDGITVVCANAQDDSPTDLACHEDCTRDCGFDASPVHPRGIKYCVCQGGVFIECRCPRAPWYKGAPSAPWCDSLTRDGSGLKAFLNNAPCEKEWQQCVARDPVDGYTPQGCACLDQGEKRPDGSPLYTWDCRSTEKWFYLEQ